MDIRGTPAQEKQITIAVPEDRVPVFYAFYGRFLAGGRGRRGARGHGRCGHGTEGRTAEAQPAAEAPGS